MQKKRNMIYLMILVIIAITLVFFKVVGEKEQLSKVNRLPQKESIILKVEYLQGEGFVGSLEEDNSSLKIKQDEKIRVVFEDYTEVIQVDGTTFEYNDEEPNAMDCNLPKGTNIQVEFESYEYIESLDSPFIVYAIDVKYL